jgi:hypothetical protein
MSQVSWNYCGLTHEAAQAQHQPLSQSTVDTSLLACAQQCQRTPHSLALNFHVERCSPQTAGHLYISNYNILNTFKLHTWRMWLYAVCPTSLNQPSVVHSTLTMIQSKTSRLFPISNTLKTSETRSLNHHNHCHHRDLHHLCPRRKHTPAPALHWAITSPRYGNVMPCDCLR